mmetsp:Transcript_15477/g.33524  ORF Transcript_15477/g.33524 Transcript_15477/m.33524 type:complete len:462 (-) Transcript_15477:183-1568(-)|eukprot:CAMPEP_0172306058 /NCGR_PEP_ID=MMETSP1058-20130122/7202_1 /TAXON_ID=83371 /ORGANISM="Detonula confervacea, Strain CCMP 353" /LENGTH=461 /DNA_ID=CAMNT_0013017829 /DNA_START=203 /DNA_END=1588 /DNA_ORIENTATION=-
MSDPKQNINDYELKRQQRQQQQSPSAARSSSLGEQSAPIAEQQPIMRSVAINPLTQNKRTLHFEPALRRVEPGGLAHLQPLRGVSQSELITSKAPPKQQLPARRKSESSLVHKWYVEHLTLPSRSDDLPLFRTSRVVHSTPANVISNRISDCLQSRSIKTKYSKTNDNVAKCRSIDFCKFTIRLYSGGEGGVLVEVQRLCGDAVSFMKDCRAVLNASEGKTEDAQSSADMPLYLRLPVSQMAFAKKVSLPPITQEEQADSVDVTAELLSSHQSDSNMLGMESLVIQTDPLKTLKSTAILASRRILCLSDPGNKAFNMHNYVMSLLIYNEESSSSSSEEMALDDYAMKLRNLAMSALSNALTLFSTENLLLSTISSNREWYTSVLIPKLLQDLSTAAHHPHDACYASRCISTLAESSVEFATKMRESGGYDAIKNAEDVGVREFALLAQDAGNCQNILRCCV